MKFHKSIVKDVTPTNQPEGSWREAENFIFSKLLNTAINENGFSLTHINGKKIVGNISLIDSTVVVFLESDEIGKYDTQTKEYSTILVDSRLNFDKRYPVRGVYEFTPSGDIVIAFIDDVNPPRILNIDTLPFKLNDNKTLVNRSNFITINIFSDLKEPRIEYVKESQRGGSLRTGTHFIVFAYKLADGSLTSWTDPSNPIYITSTKSGNKSTDIDGDPADVQTSKSITFGVTNIDQRYNSIVIGVVSRIGGNINVKRISEYKITSVFMEFEYTGSEIFEDIPQTDVLVEKISYKSAKAITVSGGSLFLGNLKTRNRDIDYQKYANNIRITPISKEVSLTNVFESHRQVETNYSTTSFMPFEVYAFYAVLNFTDGTKSQAFHIPGRESDSNTTGYYFNSQSYSDDEKLDISSIPANYAAGQFQRDKSIGARKLFQSRTSTFKTKMGYWENQNERYPDTDDFDVYDNNGKIGTLRNKPVRHHKFPSINAYYTKTYGRLSKNAPQLPASNRMPVYGIRASNIYIPDEIKDQVESVEIYYAKRTLENRTILETGFVDATGTNTALLWSFTGSLDNAEKYLKRFGDNDVNSFRPLRLYGFGLLNSKPNVLPTHIRLLGNIVNLTNPENFGQGLFRTRISNRTEFNSNFDYITGVSGFNYFFNFQDESKDIIKVSELEYLQADAVGLSYGNENREEALLARMDTPDFLTDKYSIAPCSFEILRSDVYNSFTEQSLVSTSARKFINNNDNLYSLETYSGDTFVSLYAHTQYIAGLDFDGLRTRIIECPVYSDANVGLRYEGEEENQTYPLKGSITEERSRNNFYGYNSDYSFRNELIFVSPYDTEGNKSVSDKVNRIIRTPIANTESQLLNWRNFPPDLYYELERTRGEITNLEGIGSSLFIHCKYGLYKTVSTDRLESSITEITISTKDIFSVRPKETIPDDAGYLGNQNPFCSFIFRGNYFFVDVDAGRIFIVREGVNEISNYGLRNWFRRNLEFQCVKQFRDEGINFKINTDAPTEFAGITAGYDPILNTIFVTKKDFIVNKINRLRVIDNQLFYKDNDGNTVPFDVSKHATDKSWTRSFSLEASQNGGWVSKHSYFPNMYIFNRKNLFSVDNNKIYEHNDPNSKGKYYDGIIYPSYIEYVNNERPEDSKVYYSVNWKTDFNGKEIIDSVVVYNDKYSTGIQPITPRNSSISRDTYNFNDLKNRAINSNLPFVDPETSEILDSETIDYNTVWYNKGKIKGNYIITRLITSNSNQKDLYLNSVGSEYRLAYV